MDLLTWNMAMSMVTIFMISILFFILFVVIERNEEEEDVRNDPSYVDHDGDVVEMKNK